MKIRRTAFTAIDTQGALLPAELLQRIAQQDKQDKDLRATLTPEAYLLAPNEKLADVINRSWQRLSGVWQGFQHSLGKLNAKDTAEQLTRSHWLNVLFSELGYGQLPPAPVFMVDDRPYGISHCFQHTPIHLIGARQGLDTPLRAAPGHPKLSPHSLVQEWLNRSGDHLWGMVTNGLQLRLLRDNKSLTRQAFVEFDLEQIFATDNYAEFAVFWLVCHQSRVAAAKPDECHLETYTRLATEQGVRLLDQLRGGVETAINELGAGFLAHKANGPLKARLRSGELGAQDYYRQVLRLTYRLIFLLVAEARDVLLDPTAAPEARERYQQFYSIARIRRIAEKRSGSAHGDLYEGLRLVMTKLHRTGSPELALPALGSYLWSEEAIQDVHAAQISNQALLAAVRALTFTIEGTVRRVVDYKFLGPEELGSVYESLLEMHPVLNTDLGTFKLETAAGHERKQTGSYYTPTSLISVLLDTALEPVAQRAMAEPDPEQALLNIKVCDPACGSGHFLIAAAHRLAKRLAWARTGNEEPAPEAYRHALRDVVRNCIYGVDLNEMAVELCKVNLWLEALEPGKPLSFLDHHIQCGNSLLGTTPALVSRGIPDSAFVALEGDDPQVVSAAKKSNKQERGQKDQLSFYGGGDLSLKHAEALANAVQSVQGDTEDDVRAVAAQADAYEQLKQSEAFKSLKLRYDAWCAAFMWKRVKGPLPVLTQMLFEKVSEAPQDVAPAVREEIERLAQQYRFFHFPLAFPTLFRPKPSFSDDDNLGWDGGFDVILGNPPWDKIQPEEEKFFSPLRPDIANAPSAKVRKALIEALPDEDPGAHRAWETYKRHIDGLCHFLRSSGRLRFTGDGNLNSYRIFTELATAAIAPTGRAGLIVQTGLATDESGKELFDHLLSCGRLVQFLDFENRSGFFTAVDSRFRFCLVTLQGSTSEISKPVAEFGWLLHSLDEIKEPGRLVRLAADDLLLFNPSSRTCPVFTSAEDVDLARHIYRCGEHVMLDEDRRWGEIDFLGELFNMTRDSGLFQKVPPEDALPLYEAKFIHQFDHRFASMNGAGVVELSESEKKDFSRSIKPKSFLEAAVVRARVKKRGIEPTWLAGFRDIASATNERTVIAAIFPFSAVGNNINLMLNLSAEQAALFLANANSFVFDFCARQKISGTHVNIWIFKQLPAISLRTYAEACPWSDGDQTYAKWILPRVLELTYTARDLEPFAVECGWQGPPFHWDEERRFQLRCELDAAMFHLYGLGREDANYILDTFPIVRRRDEALFGDYRTKRTILDMFDAMALAAGRKVQHA